jgi:alanine dehydrogenase
MVLYLSEEDVKQVLDMKSAIEIVEYAFKEMGLGRVEMPMRVYLHFEKYNGVLITMPAYIEDLNTAGVKVVTVHPNNPTRYHLPTVMARIILNSPEDGRPIAILDGTYITAMRTGAAGAVGIKYLSRKDSETATIIGLGVQGRSQLLGLLQVRDIKRVKVFDILPEACKAFAREMSKETGISIEPMSTIDEAVKGTDIIITCTPSTKPIIKGDMIREGMHISAIGADTKAKRELETDVLIKVRDRGKIVVDCMDQAMIVGDFAVPLQEGFIKKEDIYAEMGEIVAGKKMGRTDKNEITLFKATGLAIEDISTAYKVYQMAKEKKVGREI